LSRQQREAVGRFLTGIAAANGIIDRKEVSALRAAYRALDIGVDQLNELLEQSNRSSDEPIEVDPGDRSDQPGEAIPARAPAPSTIGLTFDEGLLKRLMAETEEVAAMLKQAMLDDTIPDISERQPVLPANDCRFESLHARFHAMLAQLLTRPAWPRTEFELLARSCSLMPDGALDAVNTWAYELFDDPIVVEQGDQLEVQIHLIETRR
jgi:TerB-C domain